MTLSQMINDVKEKLKFYSDDIDIEDEYIAHLINVKRALLVKQRFMKFTRNLPEEIKQIICVDLEVTNSIDGAPCFGHVLVSKDSIPNLIEIGGRSAIVAIRTLDILHSNLNVIPTERLPYVGINKWLQNQIYVALDANNKLYFKAFQEHHYNLEQIKLLGVFQDPEQADVLSCETDTTCDYYDKEYPVESYMVHDLINLIVKELTPGLQFPDDKINNSDESNRN